MERIIVLADFTPEAQSAVDYSYAWAAEKGFAVVLVHVYDVPMLYAPDAFSAMLLPIEEARTTAEKNLEALADRCRAQYPTVNTTTRLALLEPESVLDEGPGAAENLIVVGVNPQNLNDWWEDHAAADMLREAHHNVLAIPEGYLYRPVRNMALAVRSDQSPEALPLSRLQTVLAATGAALQVVTVCDASEPLPSVLTGALQPFNPTYHIVAATGSVEEALVDFVQSHATDWLAVIPGDYGFWGGLFHKSHTLALAGSSPLPLLALHHR